MDGTHKNKQTKPQENKNQPHKIAWRKEEYPEMGREIERGRKGKTL